MSLAGQYSETFDQLWQWHLWSRSGSVDLAYPHSEPYARMTETTGGSSSPSITDDEALEIDRCVAAFKARFDDEARALMVWLRCGCNISKSVVCLGMSRERVNQLVTFSIGWLGAEICSQVN